MQPSSTLRTTARMTFREWRNGNWSDLPSSWKPESRGEYLKKMVKACAIGLGYGIGASLADFTVYRDLELFIFGLAYTGALVVLGFALFTPGMLIGARLWYRISHWRKHHG